MNIKKILEAKSVRKIIVEAETFNRNLISDIEKKLSKAEDAMMAISDTGFIDDIDQITSDLDSDDVSETDSKILDKYDYFSSTYASKLLNILDDIREVYSDIVNDKKLS